MKSLRISLLVSAFIFSPAIINGEAVVVKGMATLDVSKIIDPKDPLKSQAVEWKDSMETFQKGLEKEQKPLQDLQAKIETQQKALEAKTKEGKQLSKEEQSGIMTMFQDLQGKTQALQQKAEAQFLQIQNEFKNKIDAAVKSVADRKGYDSVLYKDVVIYARNATDITSDVVNELNNKYAAEKRAKKMTAESSKTKA